MFRKSFAFIALVLLLTVVSVGCDSDNPQQARSVISITSINDGEVSLTSDVIYNDGTASGIFPDYVEIIFQNRPYSNMILTNPGHPFGNFEITRYVVDWESTDGSGATLPSYSADMFLDIPSDGYGVANVMVVTWQDKANPPLSGLVGGTGQIGMNAKITFYGHETGVERETSVVANLGVIFIDLNNEVQP
jgi:hypothetical protein